MTAPGRFIGTGYLGSSSAMGRESTLPPREQTRAQPQQQHDPDRGAKHNGIKRVSLRGDIGERFLRGHTQQNSRD